MGKMYPWVPLVNVLRSHEGAAQAAFSWDQHSCFLLRCLFAFSSPWVEFLTPRHPLFLSKSTGILLVFRDRRPCWTLPKAERPLRCHGNQTTSRRHFVGPKYQEFYVCDFGVLTLIQSGELYEGLVPSTRRPFLMVFPLSIL